ncbi:hypothetical protein ANTQUA_LOCUS1622 [Anthophora quadrimaculata]
MKAVVTLLLSALIVPGWFRTRSLNRLVDFDCIQLPGLLPLPVVYVQCAIFTKRNVAEVQDKRFSNQQRKFEAFSMRH